MIIEGAISVKAAIQNKKRDVESIYINSKNPEDDFGVFAVMLVKG